MHVIQYDVEKALHQPQVAFVGGRHQADAEIFAHLLHLLLYSGTEYRYFEHSQSGKELKKVQALFASLILRHFEFLEKW